MTEAVALRGRADHDPQLPPKDTPVYVMIFPNLALIDDFGNIKILKTDALSTREATVVTGLTKEKIAQISESESYLNHRAMRALTNSSSFQELRETELRLSREHKQPVWAWTRIMNSISSKHITGDRISQFQEAGGIVEFTRPTDRRSYRLFFTQSDALHIIDWGRDKYRSHEPIEFPPRLAKRK